MCRILEVSRSGFYAWCKRPKSKRHLENEKLLQDIIRVFQQSKEIYGARKITNKLHLENIQCGKNRVARLMRQNNLRSKIKRKFKATTNSRHNYPVADNLLNQNFNAEHPNQVWVGDITYISTKEGWLYLAAILDLYSRQIVGWAMDSTMTKQLVIDALKQAVGRRKPPKGIIFHSDRGSQYASHRFQKLLKKKHFISSMSGKGNCYDNACMESFFHLLKTEHVYFENYKTRAQAKQSIFQYIEIFYNRIRLHSKLGYISPCDFEKLCLAA
jgi:transposase InsO family protein